MKIVLQRCAVLFGAAEDASGLIFLSPSIHHRAISSFVFFPGISPYLLCTVFLVHINSIRYLTWGIPASNHEAELTDKKFQQL